MKSTKIILAVLFLCFTTISCIQDEEPNSEADITACILPTEVLSSPTINVNNLFDPDFNAYPIYLPIKKGVDITELAPEFELTPGASIEPASGSKHDFSKPVRYTVTSEDGKWHRTYVFLLDKDKIIPSIFHFENAKSDAKGKYDIIYEEMADHTLVWASGNAGFAFAMPSATRANYPTSLSNDGMVGNCVKMVTQSTGGLGAMVKMPIASGNLFIGKFDFDNAISEPLKATQFGEPFTYKPVKLKGWFRYKAGPEYFEGKNKVDKKDKFNIYAIFYESTQDTPMLDGYIQENNYEHPNMVALAIVDNQHETKGEEWETFDIDFDYERYGKTIDYKKLKEGKYHLGIVFAASIDGAKFNGAPGSTLMIDEMEIIYEKGTVK